MRRLIIHIIFIISFLLPCFLKSQTNWTLQNSGTTSGIFAIQFLNSNTGYACGDRIIIKSTDGGTTWNTLFTADLEYFKKLYFINENTGFAGSYGIYKTTNGGANFNFIVDVNGCKAINFINNNTGWILGSDRLLYTSDAGTSWNLKTIGQLPYFAHSISFINAQTGWMAGLYKTNGAPQEYHFTLRKTTSAGSFWTDVTFINIGLWYNTEPFVFFLNEQFGMFSRPRGYINPPENRTFIKTSNGGASWIHLQSQSQLNDIYFFNEQTGFTAGSERLDYTNNGGLNWQNCIPGITSYNDIFFLNSLTGWAAGTSGKIYKTTNAALSITQSSEIADEYMLSQNYPNPFNPETNIEFLIPRNSYVKLIIYDLQGKEIETLVNGNLQAGSYSYSFNGASYTSGVYIFKLFADEIVMSRKMVLLK